MNSFFLMKNFIFETSPGNKKKEKTNAKGISVPPGITYNCGTDVTKTKKTMNFRYMPHPTTVVKYIIAFKLRKSSS